MAERKTRRSRSAGLIAGGRTRTVNAEADPSAPKTTRPPAESRRPASQEIENPDDQAEGRLHTFDAVPDRVDVRDWFYQPSLAPLADVLCNCDLVPKVLDQGREGACTGYALASVINCLLRQRGLDKLVSPKMLYDMARRYDEWPGESYSGSSARGAMKGWLRHGVATAKTWPKSKQDLSFLQAVIDAKTGRTVAHEALEIPGGAFYRVSHREVRHMHAALAELGVLYCTLMVHDGWNKPSGAPVDVHYTRLNNDLKRSFPVIKRDGLATEGHAIAILGYTATGFIILNSWGEAWGAGGFALLPYEDFLLHATDVWAAQLGVPVTADLWGEGGADTTAGLQRATRSIPLNDIRPYIIDAGNNGKLSDAGDYWTTKEDIERLFNETIPAASADWPKKRVLFYLHGGLNSEGEVAKRVVAFRDVFLENQIYPLHIMWESGAAESFKDIFRNAIGDDRAGAADWMRKLRDGYLEARDRTVELTVSRVGGALWSTMKTNARLMSQDPHHLGALQIAAKAASAALSKSEAEWEFHVVAHSAGSIVAAHAVELFSAQSARFASLQFMAPAIRLDTFKELVLKHIGTTCPQPTLYVLSDVGERDDDVGVGAVTPYGKSLLYLVSNAFEGKRGTKILGMARYLTPQPDYKPSDVAADVDPELHDLFSRPVDGHPSLVIAGANAENGHPDPFSTSRSDSHGGFDNDPETMNSVLRRILGGEPGKRKFEVRDLQY
jgi:hypothetical protein